MKTMRYFFLFFFLLLSARSLMSQSIGNEWINYSQKYFRIPVAQNGIYRIDYATLTNGGVPLYSFDPRQIQIFCKGVEQYIYIKGENDGVFNSSDYIEFYGEKNDGWFDVYMYSNPADQVHPNFSMINDTASYYVTWNSSINNRRLTWSNNTDFSSYTAATSIGFTSRVDFNSSYFDGRINSDGGQDAKYTNCEGWMDEIKINPNTPGVPVSTLRTLSTPYPFAGTDAEIEMKFCGESNASQSPDHHLRLNFAGQAVDTLFEGYVPVFFKRTVQSAVLGTSVTLNIELPNDYQFDSERYGLLYLQAKYRRQPNLGGAAQLKFDVGDAGGATYLNFLVPAGTSSDSIIVLDLSNHRKIKTVRSTGAVQMIIPDGGGTKTCYLANNSAVIPVTKVISVNNSASNYAQFIDYSVPSFSNTDYIVVSGSTLLSEAQNYVNYRNSKGYNAILVDIETLYDQFAYGIRKHPFAIRNFVRFGLTHFSDSIKGLFLIGKAYKAGGSYNHRTSALYYNQTIVPTYANPPSDNLLLAGIIDNYYQPAIPIGRLAARKPSDVAWYLEKVMDYEAAMVAPYNPNAPDEKVWMKEVLHFAGGSDFSQSQMLLSYLNQYKDTLEGPYFGGNVRTYTKTTTDPIQQSLSDSIRTLINNGVSILNFFGHGAGIGFDISIDNPAEYDNYKKYPFVLANSCLAGDLCQAYISSSEAFVIIQNKGAIAYLGSTAPANAPNLHIYSTELISQIAHKNYGKSIGLQIQQGIKQIQQYGSFVENISYDMTLHGDPVLVLNSLPKPDFLVTSSSIYTDPSELSTELDSFQLHVVVANVGRAISDTIFVTVSRVFPDNTIADSSFRIKAPYFSDTLKIMMPIDLARGPGLNTINVRVDEFNNVDEAVETNNEASRQIFIRSNDIVPVYPYEYAVVPDTILTLVASTGYAFSDPTGYVFQIDTTDAFNSPFLKNSDIITQGGGIVSWVLPFSMLELGDSTVYFWRVSKQGSGLWRESSFQYITGKRGWGQSHIYQFKNNNYKYINYNKPQRRFDFINNVVTISVQTGFYPYIQWAEEWYKINGAMKGQWSCTEAYGCQNGMKFAVFDPVSIAPWENLNPDGDAFSQYSSLNCRTYVYYDFDFCSTDNNWYQRMVDFIDTIPNGYYVLAFSHKNHNAQNYPEALYQAFESIGSTNIRSIPNNVPYIIFGRKGYPGSADESIGLAQNYIINDEYYLNTNWNEGHMVSTTIGPASEWGSAHWRVHSADAGVWTDSVRLAIIGVTANGTIDTLLNQIRYVQDSIDIPNLSAIADASQYPYLKLMLQASDNTNHTPPQTDRWHVLYTPIPETAIDPSVSYSFYNRNVQEGEYVKLKISTKNVSPVDFQDSLMVSYWVLDASHNLRPILTHKTRLHPSGDILTDSVSFSTEGMAGNNSLWVEFNPVNPATGVYDQLEQHHFNNLGEIKFTVNQDRINPMLDVTFDGVHILDGDIVSAKPEIKFMLKDENQFLKLTDTSRVKVFITRPGTNTLERVFFMSDGIEVLRFFPATSSNNNVCRVEWTPIFTIDGTYQLMVQAQDMSGNESGSIDFKINFEVVNRPAITEVMNWPNPFSTKTHFVFTLTGSEIPEYFKIQIMTISGKIVREIDGSELGGIHIGRNITDYAWDGKDMYGDQLANGVYLYRVVVRLNGQGMEKIETDAGQYFTKEFGKMVLLR